MISKHLHYPFIFIFLLGVCSVFAQESGFIQGQLLDAKTGEPVVFATIKVKGKAKGVISNQDGGFRVPKKFKDLGDVLVISSMGYEKREMPISGLSPEHINIIRLKSGIMVLNEAVVSAKKKRKLSARSIVRKAIGAIPKTFPNNSFSTIGYYRDYQIKKNKYINLNEAILEVFDQGIDKLDSSTTKVHIYNYKKNNDFNRDARAEDIYDYKNWKKIIDKAYLFNYGGNEFTILRVHDAIRNYKVNSYDFVNSLERDLIQNHYFLKEVDTYLENEVLYTISFKNILPAYRLYGKLYVSKRDFAIQKLEYAMYDNSKMNDTGQSNKHDNKNQLIFEVISEYKRKRNKMYLNYISFKNSFQLSAPPRFIMNEVIMDKMLGCFVVSFNNPVVKFNAELVKNYNFKFKGKKITFKKIIVNSKQVSLYPDMKKIELDNMIKEIEVAARKKIELMGLLGIEVNGLKDVFGNLLNKRILMDYLQFREFFAQEVVPNNPMPKDSLFMKKNRPIFKDQPILKPDNFEEYWMNTPLQNIQE